VNEKHVEHSVVYILDIKFSSYILRNIFEEPDERAEILNFGVDNTRKRLIILSGIKNKKNRRDKFLTLFDMETEISLFRMQVTNKELIGRLKSNLYNFVDGHIYYGNNVIKIRYDVLEYKHKELAQL